MAVARIPLIGNYVSRNPPSLSTQDQIFTNCFPEIVRNPATGSSTVHLSKRLGFASNSCAPVGYVGSLGVLIWSGLTSSVYPWINSFWNGTDTVKLYNNASLIGTITGVVNCLSITETLISGVPTLVFILGSTTTNQTVGYFYPSGGSLTQITDGNFPVNLTGHVAHLDGFMFVMTQDGKIYNSNLNSVSVWSADGFISDDNYADVGTGLARIGDNIAAFGRESNSLYRNAGNPSGSPLQRIPGSASKVGASLFLPTATARKNIVNVGDTVYWIGIDSITGRIALYRLEGGTPKPVSDAQTDNYLANNTATGIAGAFSMYGQTHVLLQTNGTTAPCFCVDTNIWWTFQVGPTGAQYFSAIAGSPSGAVATGTGGGAGAASSLWNTTSNGGWQDSNANYVVSIQTAPLDFGASQRKFFKSAEIIGDVSAASSSLTLTYSDDDYASFGGSVTLDASAGNRARATRLGSSRRRSFRIVESSNRAFRAEALEIVYEVGAT